MFKPKSTTPQNFQVSTFVLLALLPLFATAQLTFVNPVPVYWPIGDLPSDDGEEGTMVDNGPNWELPDPVYLPEYLLNPVESSSVDSENGELQDLDEG